MDVKPPGTTRTIRRHTDERPIACDPTRVSDGRRYLRPICFGLIDLGGRYQMPRSSAHERPTGADHQRCYDDPLPWDLDHIADSEDLIRTSVYRCAVECPIFSACHRQAVQRAQAGNPPRSVIEGGLVWSDSGTPLNSNLTFGMAQRARSKHARSIDLRGVPRPLSAVTDRGLQAS